MGKIMSNKEKVLCDIGYGNDPPEVFLERLKAAGITVVMDVRRNNSKGRLRCYDPGVGSGMEKWLEAEGFQYLDESFFSNRCDTLEAYHIWLETPTMKKGVAVWARSIKLSSEAIICVLCACGDPFEKDGVTARCHRLPLLKALVAELGDGWTVRHI